MADNREIAALLTIAQSNLALKSKNLDVVADFFMILDTLEARDKDRKALAKKKW